MTQWGSQYLATQGYNAVSILRYYYGADIYLATANRVSGVPSSFPGYNIQLGSRGTDVRTIQRQLNAIARNYPAIPTVGFRKSLIFPKAASWTILPGIVSPRSM